MTLSISNAAALVACNGIVDLCEGGTPPATLRIYSGTPPANADASLSGNTLLAQLTMSNPAFGNAADANPGATATAAAITSDSSADATGTATFFRILTGTAGTVVMQGTVSASGGGGDLELVTTSIVAGVVVSISSLTVTVPEA